MCDLVARTGRLQQRYEDGFRLVAGLSNVDGYKVSGSHRSSSERSVLHEIDLKCHSAKTAVEHFYSLNGMCIPFRYKDSSENGDVKTKQALEVLMITSTSGPGLLFPKGGWETDETREEAAVREAIEEAGVRGDIVEFLGEHEFKSKTHQDEFSPEGICRAAMFALYVKEELNSWPEQSTRNRRWLTIPEAAQNCRHPWMRKVLQENFCKWYDNSIATSDGNNNHVFSVYSPPDE